MPSAINPFDDRLRRRFGQFSSPSAR